MDPGAKDSEFTYYIAVASDKEPPQGMHAFTIPGATWAIFDCVGPMPQAIQELQRQIATQWLPTSGYEYANGPDIELYGDGDTNAADYHCQVWLPVTKKD